MKILITDFVHPVLIEQLNEVGEVTYEPDISYEKVLLEAPSFQGLVINSKVKATAEMIANCPDLEFIARLGSGLDIIDLPACKKAGVRVLSAPQGNANAVAEHALAMILSLFNTLEQAHREVAYHHWDRESVRGIELDGRVVGVIGCGNNGSAFVKKLRGFDVEVLIYDKYKPTLGDFHPRQKVTSQAEVIERSDVISLHIPLTQETENMVDMNFLKRMRKSSVLVNTSRGRIVNEEDLIEILQNGHLFGACLDVFHAEKPKKYKKSDLLRMEALAQLNNCVLSPHVAGWTHESFYRIGEILGRNIKSLYI